MSRIRATFEQAANEGRKLLIPYITAGDPNLKLTQEILIEIACSGADIIELGVPFSDPMADGPVIQRAAERALKEGVNLAQILDMVAQVRKSTSVPIILFSYYNPLLQYGLDRLCQKAAELEIDGLLVTDLSPEESGELLGYTDKFDIDLIFLLAPTSSDARIKRITEVASGFIYALSRTGVTGMKQSISETAPRLIKRIRDFSTLPVAVGFGISTVEQVKEVWQYAEAAVVGSRIVSEIEVLQKEVDAKELVKRVGNLVREFCYK
ncbi:MAG: tryptophan synthase subunit alpha [Blastocatellia bacterium]|nr:tryptophan synthase subunit alpha [Blastocatellia bacterium]